MTARVGVAENDAATLQARCAHSSPTDAIALAGMLHGLVLESFCQLTDGAVLLTFADGSTAHVTLGGQVRVRGPDKSA